MAEAFLCLLLLDLVLPRWPLEKVQARFIPSPRPRRGRASAETRQRAAGRAVRAVAAATRLYYRRREDCLPRALTLCRLLRRCGLDAQVCLGVKQFPFRAHAWVELGDEVIGDSPRIASKYQRLARLRGPEEP